MCQAHKDSDEKSQSGLSNRDHLEAPFRYTWKFTDPTAFM